MLSLVTSISLLLGLLPTRLHAQSSCGPAPSGSIQPSVASGYRSQVVHTGLASPRGILLDNAGNLLVVEQDSGVISAHSIGEENGCLSVLESSDVTDSIGLNHGIEISPDGAALYASTPDEAYSWDYDSATRQISNQRTLVGGMQGTDHSTRTLLLSRTAPGMLSIARGSFANIDFEAASVSTGHSQVRAFNLTNLTGVYDYTSDGLRLGWGLRNEVGLAEHPTSGGIWGVENSADQQTRMGVDIHADNPAEELNFFGYLDGTDYPDQGSNFGYPWCFSAWDVSVLPENEGLEVGSQYAIDATSDSNNENRTDEYCAEQTEASLVFDAHMAPLDIKFNDTGRQAWITFHGSWNRDDPIGYKLSVVQFNEDGSPVDDLSSRTAATDIFSNTDLSNCPRDCFRPVGMAIDSQGRIFMSSDSSGEIYLISRVPGNDTGSGGNDTESDENAATTLTASYSHPLTVGACLAIIVSVFL